MNRISPTRSPLLMQPPIDPTKINRPLSQQMTQQIIQQQHNRMNHMNESLEKQRVMQQLDKKLHDTVAAVMQANHMQANNNMGLQNQINNPSMNVNMMPHPNHNKPVSMDYSRYF
jgi:predicted nucleotide-binding protein (sugar kinase/HSP70/actin superfamily)